MTRHKRLPPLMLEWDKPNPHRWHYTARWCRWKIGIPRWGGEEVAPPKNILKDVFWRDEPIPPEIHTSMALGLGFPTVNVWNKAEGGLLYLEEEL